MVPFSDERADSQVHKTSSDQAELNAVDYDSEFLRKFHWTFVVNKQTHSNILSFSSFAENRSIPGQSQHFVKLFAN